MDAVILAVNKKKKRCFDCFSSCSYDGGLKCGVVLAYNIFDNSNNNK